MLHKVEIALMICVVACFAYWLGWSMRGDAIYSAMFNHSVSMMPKIK